MSTRGRVANNRLGGLDLSSSDLLADRNSLCERLEELGRELADEERTAALIAIARDEARNFDSLRDALSTSLMEVYRLTQSRGAFGLLYELNRSPLLQQVMGRLRRYQSKADPNDVLQEVFFNVYRYPHRFDCQREDAFRVWTATIVRNTVLKHLRSLSRSGRAEVPFEDLSEHPEEHDRGPLGGVIDQESESECNRVYLTYLHLYLRFYSMLSERERRAIHLVEVGGHSYRESAADLGIKLENLKMVIFRARRKIHRAMRRVFEGLPPDCRPARDPRPEAAMAASLRDRSGGGSNDLAERAGGEESVAAGSVRRSRTANDLETPPNSPMSRAGVSPGIGETRHEDGPQEPGTKS